MKALLVICLILLSSFPSLAKGGKWTYLHLKSPSVRVFDFNRDGKSDFEERFRDGKLVETHYDSDGDGKYDRHTIVDAGAEVFKIVDLDKTKHQARKRLSYWTHEMRMQTIVHVQVDKDADGSWDLSYEMSTPIDQQKTECSSGGEAPEVIGLAEDALAICLSSQDYLATDFGYQVDRSCIGGERSWVLPLLKESITAGRLCLTELSQQGMRGAARLLSSLESLLSENNVQILCSETGYNWKDTVLAHATTGEDSSRSTQLRHPGISLGPQLFSRPRTAENIQDFRATIFHEQLHNTGSRHGVDPEISYTCESCCFPPTSQREGVREVACRICGGDYSSITDLQYLRDITEFGELSLSTDQGVAASLAFLRENEDTDLGLAFLSANSSEVIGPVGTELSRILLGNPELSEEERSLLARNEFNRSYAVIDPYRPGGRVVAEAYVRLFRDRNPEAALRHLRENAPLLRAQMALRSGDSGSLQAENIRENIDDLLAEVWYRGYRGSAPLADPDSTDPLSDEAHALIDQLGISR